MKTRQSNVFQQPVKLAPFHLLATEGRVHIDRDHVWHIETLGGLAQADSELLLATPFIEADLTDETSQESGIRWWEELTERGGEGIVVKPKAFIAKGRRGIAQLAVKCRGREYLRIVYGPEYTVPENLERFQRACHQEVAGATRVRPRDQGPGAFRSRGTADPCPRVRLRGTGSGERAGRPALVGATTSVIRVDRSAFIASARSPAKAIIWPRIGTRAGL
jgi:hypothetical protein